MDQMTELHLENARRQIDQLTEQLEAAHGKIAATALLAQAAAVAIAKPEVLANILEMAERQFVNKHPHVGPHFADAFDNAIANFRQTLESVKVSKQGDEPSSDPDLG